MLRLASTAFIAMVVALPASAQNLEVIKARKETLKAMGDAAKVPGAMLKQEVPFDLDKVQASLKVFQEKAARLPDMFPDDAKTGGDTEALPVIWEKKQDVVERFDKLVADAKAAEGKITDEFSFQDEFPKVAGNCSGCHKIYREQKR